MKKIMFLLQFLIAPIVINFYIAPKIMGYMIYEKLIDPYLAEIIVVLFIILLMIFLTNTKKSLINSEEIKKIKIKELCIYAILIFLVGIVIEFFIPKSVPSDSSGAINNIDIFLSCVFAPVYEELTFNRIVFFKLKEKYNVVLTIFVATLIFVLIHNRAYVHPLIFINMFLGRVVEVVLYKRTNNIMLPIVSHMFHNSFLIFFMVSGFILHDVLRSLLYGICYVFILLLAQKLYFMIKEKKQGVLVNYESRNIN